MARGWESKSVEDQKEAAESARATGVKRKLTPEEMERQATRDGLLLSRTRTLNALQGACDARYRALLETTLAHVDEQLKQLDAAANAATTPPQK
jgi:vacuolar-type H+-ATPase subunit E/Vma4